MYARLGDVAKLSLVALNAAAYRLAIGDVAGARETAREALELAMEARAGVYIPIAIQRLGTVAALLGDARRGALLLSYADRWLDTEGFGRELTEQRTYDMGMDALRLVLDPQALADLEARGTDLSEAEAVEEARRV